MRVGQCGAHLLDKKTLDQAERIVDRVRRGGDRALLKAVRRYDGVDPATLAELRLEPTADPAQLPPGFEEALARAIAAVERYHRHQVHAGFTVDEEGVVLEERRRPLSRVGIYVPGGRAAYPSSVLMTVIPARLAGAREIVVATPPATWEANGRTCATPPEEIQSNRATAARDGNHCCASSHLIGVVCPLRFERMEA